ncbi:hypothetical protein ASF49_08190 [Methylobacterium sp. Leaf104]|uniref:hypothetical protein n=1 Tax=Methylobacterium TaxID=407 RepID=UPI0006FF7BA7|nr:MULTISPECIES: hypothetical protein [Methylobacterium]KQP33837.1 hypothetical protein ASF49_08190 [Methylobacterium sp. Leaf104]MCI9879595.1 hypothetical protein [Methylobacterium goesingense]
MDAILTTLVGDAKPLALIAGILGAVLLAWPWIRKNFREISDAEAIRVAGDALRKEMGELLDKEQAKVVTLTASLDEASTQMRGLREENGGLKADMASLRKEVRAMVRMCLSMRRAMQRAVDTGDCAPLRLWLDLNPGDEDEDMRPAA